MAERSTSVIEVRIRELSQLFNSLDPSPFRERDIEPAAEDHIVGWARELPTDTRLEIHIHLPREEAVKARQLGLAEALQNYFSERAAKTSSDLRELFRNGWRFLIIGLTVLLLCLMGSQLIRANLGTGAFARTLAESLIILGWVANWRPIETFLYDWLPIRRRRELYRRLACAPVHMTVD